MSKVLVITANPKKKGALATLTAEVIRGVSEGGAGVEEIRLADCDIGYCNFCLRCYRDPESDIGVCSQDDDMKWILEKVEAADGYVMVSQVSSAHANARFKTFMERSSYTAGRSTGKILWIKGIPESRFKDKQRYAVTLVTAGSVPTWMRAFCNVATKQMSELARVCFNAKVVGRQYAGKINFEGLRDGDREKAHKLGRKLAARVSGGS